MADKGHRAVADRDIDHGGDVLQLVTFTVAGEIYAVPVDVVDEIIRMQPIADVPEVPAYIEGITNLRGNVVPVVNLRRRLSLPGREAIEDSIIIVVEREGERVGLLVDGVNEVVGIPMDEVEPPSAVITSADTDLLQAVSMAGGRLVIILDLDRALSRTHEGLPAVLPPAEPR